MNQIDIVNMALANVGAQEVETINENSLSAQVVRTFWNLALETTLRAHTWSCATRMMLLSHMDNQGIDKKNYPYYYHLPHDYVRMVKAKCKSKHFPRFKIFEKVLFIEDVLTELSYISSDILFDNCDAGFINCLISKLTELICYRLDGTLNKRDYYQKKFEELLITARGQDACDVNNSRPYLSTICARELSEYE